jgi:hypothetical protein
MSACPNRIFWQQLLDEQLSSTVELQLEQHLEHCAECQRLLGELASASASSQQFQNLQNVRTELLESDVDPTTQFIDRFIRDISKAEATRRPLDSNDSDPKTQCLADRERLWHCLSRHRVKLAVLSVMLLASIAIISVYSPSMFGGTKESTKAGSLGSSRLRSPERDRSGEKTPEFIVRGTSEPLTFSTLSDALQHVNTIFGGDVADRNIVISCHADGLRFAERLIVPSGCSLTLESHSDRTTRLQFRKDSEQESTPLWIVRGVLRLTNVDLETIPGAASARDSLIDVDGGTLSCERCRLVCDDGSLVRLRREATAKLVRCKLHAGRGAAIAVSADNKGLTFKNCLVSATSGFLIASGPMAEPLTIEIDRSRFFGRTLLQFVPARVSGYGTSTQDASEKSPAFADVRLQRSAVAMPLVAEIASNLYQNESAARVSSRETNSEQQTDLVVFRSLLRLEDSTTLYLRPQQLPDPAYSLTIDELGDIYSEPTMNDRTIDFMPGESQRTRLAFENPHDLTAADFEWLSFPER